MLVKISRNLILNLLNNLEYVKKFSSFLILISIATSILFLSCSKSSGPQGETGPAGAAGQQGAQGVPGNANVKVDTFTVLGSQWSFPGNYSLSFGSGGATTFYQTKYFDQAFTQITDDILTSGMVLVFFRPNDNNTSQWAPLPYFFTTGSGYNYNFVFVTSPGTVRLHFYLSEVDPSIIIPAVNTINIHTYKFKIVAVSGTIATRLRDAHVDLQDYEQVSKCINL